LTQLFVSVLRAEVPGFSSFVSSSTNPSFPVQSTNRSLVTTAADGVMPLLNANSYSFAFWQLYDISLVGLHLIRPWLTPSLTNITLPSHVDAHDPSRGSDRQ